MKKQITLQTKSGEIIAEITTVKKGSMVAEFVLNGKMISGNIDSRKRLLKISENIAAKIKETHGQLAAMYNACFEIKFDKPFLETNNDGERMVKKGTKTNLFTREIQTIEKTLWSK